MRKTEFADNAKTRLLFHTHKCITAQFSSVEIHVQWLNPSDVIRCYIAENGGKAGYMQATNQWQLFFSIMCFLTPRRTFKKFETQIHIAVQWQLFDAVLLWTCDRPCFKYLQFHVPCSCDVRWDCFKRSLLKRLVARVLKFFVKTSCCSCLEGSCNPHFPVVIFLSPSFRVCVCVFVRACVSACMFV